VPYLHPDAGLVEHWAKVIREAAGGQPPPLRVGVCWRGVVGPAIRFEFRRDPGDRPFGDRELAIVGAMAGANWLHPAEPDVPGTGLSAMIDGLPRRQHQDLDRLRNGDSSKQLAKTLGMTTNTAKEHVKRLCKRFNVSSRPELIARLYCGDEVKGAFDRGQAVRGGGPEVTCPARSGPQSPRRRGALSGFDRPGWPAAERLGQDFA